MDNFFSLIFLFLLGSAIQRQFVAWQQRRFQGSNDRGRQQSAQDEIGFDEMEFQLGSQCIVVVVVRYSLSPLAPARQVREIYFRAPLYIQRD